MNNFLVVSCPLRYFPNHMKLFPSITSNVIENVTGKKDNGIKGLNDRKITL